MRVRAMLRLSIISGFILLVIANSSVVFAEECPGKANAHITSVTQEGNKRTIRCACDDRYVSRGNACEAIVQLQVQGAIPLPKPTWDCYCEYRFVVRPNEQIHPQVMRTPE